MFPCSVSILSTDDMAKIKVGPPAVSQYHQVRKMFMKDDNMNLPDYGFPIPRYLLNTLGYMWLQITLKIKLLSATFSHQHHSTLQMKMINSNMISNMISSKPLSLSEIPELQLESHLYICSTSDQISKHIFEEIKNF